MYNNTGEKIKRKASTICGIKIFFNIAIACCLLIYFIYITTIPLAKWPEWMPLWFPFVIIGAIIYFAIYKPISTWNQYILMASYGELIEETAKAATQLEEIKEILINNAKEK